MTVTDANDCVLISEILFVPEPDPLSGTISTSPDVNQQANGTATVVVSGGTAPYSYIWDASTGSQNTATAINLSAGNYSVTVTDANGCLFVVSVVVESSAISSTLDQDLIIEQLELFPNPTTKDAQLMIALSQVAEIDIRVFDMTGRQLVGAQEHRASQLLTLVDLEGQPSGIYMVKVAVDDVERTLLLLKAE